MSSSQFVFLVGPEKKSITIHTALVAHHSDVLNNLMNGEMYEAKNGRAYLEDVDEGTFIRFSEFAYKGDYPAGRPMIWRDNAPVETEDATQDDNWDQALERSPSSVAPPEENVIISSGFGTMSRKKHKKAKGFYEDLEVRSTPVVTPVSKKEALLKEFESQGYTIKTPAFRARKNRDPAEDYTPVFLSHAAVYVFAEKYQIAALQSLALHKLQRTLLKFTLYKERVGDVVGLIEYTYNNTPQLSEGMDQLRYLVIVYTAYVVEYLTHNDRFQSLLDEGRGLAKDLISQMVKRLD